MDLLAIFSFVDFFFLRAPCLHLGSLCCSLSLSLSLSCWGWRVVLIPIFAVLDFGFYIFGGWKAKVICLISLSMENLLRWGSSGFVCLLFWILAYLMFVLLSQILSEQISWIYIVWLLCFFTNSFYSLFIQRFSSIIFIIYEAHLLLKPPKW